MMNKKYYETPDMTVKSVVTEEKLLGDPLFGSETPTYSDIEVTDDWVIK